MFTEKTSKVLHTFTVKREAQLRFFLFFISITFSTNNISSNENNSLKFVRLDIALKICEHFPIYENLSLTNFQIDTPALKKSFRNIPKNLQ